MGVAAGPAWAQPRTVTDIRFWSIGDTTRVAIEVSGEFKFRSDRLSKPDRVFFDISNAVPADTQNIHVGDALLKQIRVAENRPGLTRVVLDIEDGVEVASSQLSNPERLMIELRSKSAAAAPAAAPAAARTKVPATSSPMQMETAIAAVARVTAPANAIRTEIPPEPIVTAPQSTASDGDASAPEPRAATRNLNGDRSLTRVLGLKLGRVVIDPGHGGHDQGTHGKSGLLEKDLVLDVSKRLAALLRERLGAEVILTRTEDVYLSLEDRTRIANQSQADLFLSIHVNSSPIATVAGVETYYLNFSASREDLDLATRENTTSDRTIFDLKEVVSKIALRAKLDESREFAVRLQRSLQSKVAAQNKDAKDRGVKRAPFVVLIGTDMPSVLAEVGFVSNTRDESLLKTDAHRARIAEALFDGIEAYAKTLSESQVAQLEE